ncbi:30S ribosomal protein S20 [Candidatus Wolfebacteria bacterium RIFCSPLOWO2_01_FULL_45_19]|uniref:Small ribosomal subunit protein bS20 n=1 Tax=Candidatus Wolfebacteria bacterium RIFCSPLOWO2_01_FULL_45_19 TaxID=1802557 RepID=A0A1F8DS40_9BACT|nr:MAG: 30S ribosomal protein S20 [Parcubacteria group bacterium GW2011_GWB1_45_9]OGM91440.1 MAG: 30S ribosomal protein S20 [Candidatus Wolfebacteria bacterium RIFCSPLOWO2_01_FULL_45_19]
MPILKSAKKALRQNIRRRERNVKGKKALAAVLKQYRKMIAAKDIEKAKAYLPKVYKALDKAANANLIKKNKASRLKSRLSAKTKIQ